MSEQAETPDTAGECPHLPPGERYSVNIPPPRNATVVECPCCHLRGWFDDDSPEPMICPYCGLAALAPIERAEGMRSDGND